MAGEANARSAAVALPGGAATAAVSPDDEAYWAGVAASYDTNEQIVNLENGNWGIMSRPVMAEYMAHTERVNRQNSFFVRSQYGAEYRRIHGLLARRLGTGEDEIALTRGATEALQGIIGGFHRLGPQDTVLYADLDYDSVAQALVTQARRCGASPVKLALPEGANEAELIAFYSAAMDRHPRTRLLLLTHISHRTGLLLPVSEICAEARRRGVRTVVDAAHSWGQVPFTAPELGADYIGFNLHKWIGAPLGVGIMYIRRSRLDDIAPNASASDTESGAIHGRVHTGTRNFAALLTIPGALAFQDSIGWQAKTARLRYLRDLWVSRARAAGGIEVLTPDDSRLYAGITAFRLSGQVSIEANRAVSKRLLDEFGIFTVARSGVAAGSCVRVTPSVYNSAGDVTRLARALERLVA